MQKKAMKKDEEKAQDPMDIAREVMRSLYTAAPSGALTELFLDRPQITPILEEAMGEAGGRINLPALMKGEGYLCQRINGRPYWLAIAVV
jgi:hypothetical protein